MEKYAKIINKRTKEVQIGVGVDEEYYVEIGMKPMDVEQSYNGLWYVAGHAPVEPEPSIEDKKEMVRYNRDVLLNQYDFTQLPDAPFTSEEKAIYASYRQYLRDYTKQEEWWVRNPYNFEEWCNSAQPSGE